ncbi:MAG: NAD-dependent epimerase/dehydratase family protein [Terracidiphilus sp.]|nr:NAD-dependent epimerase/dehydratase family protein [Terracidiphilus sp.]
MVPIIAKDMEFIAKADLPWQELNGSNVLVTGASGMLTGYMIKFFSYLNKHVLRKPALIYALVRNGEKAKNQFKEELKNKEINLIVQDASIPLKSNIDYDYIIHAASQASPIFYKTDPVGTLSANIFGAKYLLEYAREHGCRSFLYFSSGDVYGAMQDCTTPFGEDEGGFLDPADIRSCYGESKRMAENMCVCWASQYAVPTRIVRPFHTYGPGMRLDDGRVFADFVRDILRGGPIVLHSDGQARRCFCYIADATAGFFTAMLQGKNAEAYNVANPVEECSIAELAQRLSDEFKNEKIAIEYKDRQSTDYVLSPIPGNIPSVDKLRSLGWYPKISIEDGFRRTVESFRNLE